MISFTQRQTTAHRNRQARADMIQLLARAKVIMSRWSALHTDSVRIGMLQEISYSGTIDSEIEACRKTVEMADRLCADIDLAALSMGGENNQETKS